MSDRESLNERANKENPHRIRFDCSGVSEMDWGAGHRGAGLGPRALHLTILSQKKWDTGYATTPLFFRSEDRFEYAHRPSAHFLPMFLDYYRRISQAVQSHVQPSHRKFLWLSGDHSSTPGWFHGLRHRFPSLHWGMVWIDAHADIHTPHTSPSLNVHGMTLAMMLALQTPLHPIRRIAPDMEKAWKGIARFCTTPSGQPLLQPDDLFYVALRDCEPQECELIDKLQIDAHWMKPSPTIDVDEVVDRIQRKFHDRDAVFISFDIDSIDARWVPGTGTPVPGGMQWEEAASLIERLYCAFPVAALEIVEVNPIRDVRGQTVQSAADLLTKVMAP